MWYFQGTNSIKIKIFHTHKHRKLSLALHNIRKRHTLRSLIDWNFNKRGGGAGAESFRKGNKRVVLINRGQI